MKAYTYTAKDGAGAIKRGVLQAADRGTALAALKARGLTPVSVTEGGQAPREAALPAWCSARALALVGLAVLLGGVVLIGIKNAPVKPSVKKNSKEIEKSVNLKEKEIDTLVVKLSTNNASSSGQQQATAVSSMPDVKKTATGGEEKTENPLPQMPQILSTNQVVTPPPPEFSTGTERVINMIVNARLGYPPPPLPMIPITEDIGKILNKSIALYDDDTEELAERKANVAYAKQLLKAYLAEGGTVETFLSHYRDELKKAHVEWDAAQKHMIELFRNGDTKGALDYAKEQNKDFETRGIRQIYIPIGQ